MKNVEGACGDGTHNKFTSLDHCQKKLKTLVLFLHGNAWFQNKYMLLYKCIFKKIAILSCKCEWKNLQNK